MNYESQNIEYKHCGMSVYITRRKGLFGENGPVNDPVNGPVNDGVKWTRNELRILDEMVHNNDITYIELQTKLKISEPTVRRAIKRLRINMMIVREGSDKSGHWYVTEKGKEML